MKPSIQIKSSSPEAAAVKGPSVSTKSIPGEEFLTTKELMHLFKIKHRQTVYELIKDGLPVIQVGRGYRFYKQEVFDFFKFSFRAKNSYKGET